MVSRIGPVQQVASISETEARVLGTADEVTEARARAQASTGSPGEQAKDEKELVESMRRLLAVAEAYPDLKASDHYLALQQELANTEDRIQAARRFYNGNVRDLNTRVEVFPFAQVNEAFAKLEQEKPAHRLVLAHG